MNLSHAQRSWNADVEPLAPPPGWSTEALLSKEWDFPGFGPLTRVDTISGAFPAQTLRIGDRVRTRRGDFAEIRWIDRVLLDEAFLHRHPEAQPIVIPARALGRGLPHNDVVLSPGQAISGEGLMWPQSHRSATDLREARLGRGRVETIFTYTMFLCARPVEVRCEGLWIKLEPPRW